MRMERRLDGEKNAGEEEKFIKKMEIVNKNKIEHQPPLWKTILKQNL